MTTIIANSKKTKIDDYHITNEEVFYQYNWDKILDIYYFIKTNYEAYGFINTLKASDFYDIIYKSIAIYENNMPKEEEYDSDYSADEI